MIEQRFTVIPAVYIIFRRDGEILLARRFQTSYHDGDYSLPAGHVDGGEPAIAAAIREAKEEVGVTIEPEDLRFVHLMHRQVDPDDRHGQERVDIFFEAHKWEGEITNCEPHKCDDLLWCNPKHLPKNTISEVAHALQQIAQNNAYSHYNF